MPALRKGISQQSVFDDEEIQVDYEQAQLALHAGELSEVVIAPAEDANGWVILLGVKDGRQVVYTGHTGTEKVYHDLDNATAVAREIGFESIRVEERF